MLISIIIPVYNEEKTIVEILNKINNLNIWKSDKYKNKYNKEIIVVNDGSSDRSEEILRNNQNLYTKFINNKKNYGKGHAVKEGLKSCTGSYVIFQDSDNEYDPDDYQKFIECVEKFNCDFIVGSRFNYDKYIRSHNILNRMGNWIITFFFNIFYNATFSDIYCCYIFFKKNLIDINQIKSTGFEQHAEIICSLMKKSRKAYEVPVNYNGRTISDGKKIRFYHTFPILFQIVKSRFF